MQAGFQSAGQALARLYPMGISLVWKAPLVLALVVVPEFLQHVAEIQLGMFDSKARAIAVANDPTRWAFGYAKIAGLVLAFFAAARFWAARERGVKWYQLSDIVWSRFALGRSHWYSALSWLRRLRPRRIGIADRLAIR